MTCFYQEKYDFTLRCYVKNRLNDKGRSSKIS